MTCQSLVQGLERIAARRGDAVAVVSVVIQDEYGELATAGDAATWARWFELQHSEVLADTDGAFWTTWSPEATIPTTVLLDPEGVVRWRSVGDVHVVDELRDQLDALIAADGPGADR